MDTIYHTTVFDQSSYYLLQVKTGHTNQITGLISLSGLVITSSFDKKIKCWNERTMRCVRWLQHENAKRIESLLKINNTIFMSYEQGAVYFWNAKSFKLIRKINTTQLQFNPQFEICLSFANQYVLINTVNNDQLFSIDFTKGSAQVDTFPGFQSRISSFIELDSDHFAIGQNKIFIFNFHQKQLIRDISYTKTGYDELSIVKPLKKKDLLIAGSLHGFIFVADWVQGVILYNIYINGPQIKHLLVLNGKRTRRTQKQQEKQVKNNNTQNPSKQESLVISINRDKSIQIWDFESKQQKQTLFLDRQDYLFTTIQASNLLSVDKVRKEIEIRQVRVFD